MHRSIQGRDRLVEIDKAGQTVAKTYLRYSHETAVRQVEREVSYATRLSAALSNAEGLTCPGILEWDQSPPPRLVMKLCPGEALSNLLRQPGNQDIVFTEIADRIHRGLHIYINLFGEPYHDFGFHNMLYDKTTRVLTLLDFGLPARLDETHWNSPLEASLGNLVACACYELVRPSRLFSPKRGYRTLLQAALAAFEGEVCKCRIHAAVQSNLERLTRTGSSGRRKYYSTFGAAMVRRYLDSLGLRLPAAVSAICRTANPTGTGELCAACGKR